MIEAPSITTHVGFIPEDPAEANYRTLVPALRDLAKHCRDRGIGLNFETGQEAPVTILPT
jgi:L-ribulose-5-phosphate 3-epimerase